MLMWSGVSVLALHNVQHVQKRVEDATSELSAAMPPDGYHVCVCDMNCDPRQVFILQMLLCVCHSLFMPVRHSVHLAAAACTRLIQAAVATLGSVGKQPLALSHCYFYRCASALSVPLNQGFTASTPALWIFARRLRCCFNGQASMGQMLPTNLLSSDDVTPLFWWRWPLPVTRCLQVLHGASNLDQMLQESTQLLTVPPSFDFLPVGN